MATTTTIPSSPVPTKLSHISLTSTLSPRLYTHFTLPNSLKPSFKLTTLHQFPLTPFILPHFHCSFSAFQSFEPTQDEETNEESDPEQAQLYNDDDDDDDDDVANIKTRESNEEAKLYVGNLPYTMTAAELTEVFEEAGRVLNVEVIYDRVTDRSRGFGFVSMGSVEEAKQAINLFNGSQVGGRTLTVNFPEVPKGGEREVIAPKIRSTYKGFIESPHKIYAGNLGWSLTSQGLRDAFADQPGILSARVIYERDSGRSRGFGFVSFETAEDAEAALNAKNGVEVQGRPLRLNMAADRARSSSPAAPQSDADNNTESSERGELLSSISG